MRSGPEYHVEADSCAAAEALTGNKRPAQRAEIGRYSVDRFSMVHLSRFFRSLSCSQSSSLDDRKVPQMIARCRRSGKRKARKLVWSGASLQSRKAVSHNLSGVDWR
jgi:hypothetical protein